MSLAAIATIVLAVLRELPDVAKALSSDQAIELAGALADAIARLTSGETVEDVLAQPLRRADAPDLDRLRIVLLGDLPLPVDPALTDGAGVDVT